MSLASSMTAAKKMCRQKARKLHPDVNKAPDAQEQFQKIQLAYEVLSDPQKKSMYDRCGPGSCRALRHFCARCMLFLCAAL